MDGAVRIALLCVIALAAMGQAAVEYVGQETTSPPTWLAKAVARHAQRPVIAPSTALDTYLRKFPEGRVDFGRLTPQPRLPDALTTMRDGRVVQLRDASAWPARRAEIAELVEDYLVGHAPAVPTNLRAEVVDKRFNEELGHEVWQVVLRFGPDERGKLRCRLFLPRSGEGRPAPVFLGDSDEYLAWTAAARDAGFALCIYDALDPGWDDTARDDSFAYAEMYGLCDWSSFRRRGWSASRVVDWLRTLEFIDADRIFIGGYSRSAKQALIAAAFDERIAGVLFSSGGGGGGLAPYRLSDLSYYGESAEVLTRAFPDWVLPRVRLFAGRENLLPADSHWLLAMIAPRPLLLTTGKFDPVENTWVCERVHESVRAVYELLGAGTNLGLYYREGGHFATPAEMQQFSAFLVDAAEGRPIADRFPYEALHPWNYERWAAERDVSAPPPAMDAPTSAEDAPAWVQNVRRRMLWLLGDGPEYGPASVDFDRGLSDEQAALLMRGWPAPPEKIEITFGDGVNGSLYYPDPAVRGSGAKLPGVVLLTPLNTAVGYVANYRTDDQIAYIHLARRGNAVLLAFDPIGTALRQQERQRFFDEHPDWSLMGRLVRDARHAIDALRACPEVDGERIYVVGYGMGGMTAAFVAALDERLAGVAMVDGWTPLRSDSDDRPTGGARRWSHDHGLLPRLGAYVGGREGAIPVDFEQMLTATSGRVLVIHKGLNWHADGDDVREAVASAAALRTAMGRDEQIEMVVLPGPTSLDARALDVIIAWMRSHRR